MTRWRNLTIAALGLGFAVGACSPTYRKDQLVESIQHICANDYHLNVSARLVGHTLAVHLHHDNILDRSGAQIRLSQSANKILGNLIESVHRVILSSDAQVDFYVVLASDPAVPGAYLTVVRYMEDVRRANANMLPLTEFFSRTIFDLKYLALPKINLDQVVFNDIQFEQFLSWQLAKRIENRLSEELQHRGIPTTANVAGQFDHGEFIFTLNVTPESSAVIDNEFMTRIFQEATGVIAKVLAGYQFQDFQAVRLTHPPTGRSLMLPKTRLDLFR